MKKMIAVLLGIMFITGVSARPAAHIGGGFHGGGRTTVIVGGGLYSPFYSPFGFYYGYPFYPYASVPVQPSKLDLQIEGIKNDYSDKIKSAKMDDSLTRQERRQTIRTLKSDRDNAILDAKKSYYKS
ncbi:MAG: hypothetical protein J0I41_04970 [Filimonas sp.]|nr:hypothetical protein [Filimonas sp.]